MKILFRILFLSTCGVIAFYFWWTLYHQIIEKKSPIQIPTWEQIESRTENRGAICIKNPQVEFFMYHYIRDHDPHDTATTKELSVAPSLFEAHMQKVESLAKEKKITLMKWDEFLESLKSGCFPWKNIWIFTADDGWIDMRDSLVPLASKHEVPFFLGIITNRLDKGGFLSRDDVMTLAKNPLISIASHSVSHTDNSKLSEWEETHEMCDSQDTLKKLTWQKVETYIYPSGRINANIDESVAKKCGYALAWSTSFGTDYNDHTGSIYDLNRRRIFSETEPHFYDLVLEKQWAKKR